MCTHYAATAPEFFLHHAFLDKIWFLWQQKSSKHKNAFFGLSEKKLTGFPHMAKELINSHSLPGLVKVTYSKYPDSKRIYARDIGPEPGYVDGKYKRHSIACYILHYNELVCKESKCRRHKI